jgi:hypothetical protein
MMSRSTVGILAGFGSFLGLVAGGVAGNALAKLGGTRNEKTGTMVLATILGAALGAGIAASLASPTVNTSCTSVAGT